jgi:exonuclease III
VWFDDFALRQRALELCRLIKEVSPDIICLQEGK